VRLDIEAGRLQLLGDGTRALQRDLQRRAEIGIIGIADDEGEALLICKCKGGAEREENGDGARNDCEQGAAG
jgi:hypothetical protein